MIRVVLTGGGTGGHIYPLLSIAKALREKVKGTDIKLELIYIGVAGDYAPLFEEEGIRVKEISGGKLRRYVSLQNIIDIPKFFWGILQSWILLYRYMPDAIFSKGGTGSLPVVLMGCFYRIPIMIHESDTVPGLNNIIASKFASRVAVSFESALTYFHPQKGVHTGNPLKKGLPAATSDQKAAKQALGFDSEKPLLLVLGGSQGSERVNNLILSVIPSLTKKIQILHQTGTRNFLEVSKLSKVALMEAPVEINNVPLKYEARAYLKEEISTAYVAADIILSRAGSNSIFEIAAHGKPAILIPLHESANDHQRKNAYAFGETGAAIVMEEQNLLPQIFLTQLFSIMDNTEKKIAMGKASALFFKPNASETIAEEMLALVGH